MGGRYEEIIDRESAYELLKSRAEEEERMAAAEAAEKDASRASSDDVWLKPKRRRSSNRQSFGEAIMKSAARKATTMITGKLVRGLLGSLLGGSR